MKKLTAISAIILSAGSAFAQATFTTITPAAGYSIGLDFYKISSDGHAVVGTAKNPDFSKQYSTFRWTAANGMQILGKPANIDWYYGHAVSGNGSIVGAKGNSLADSFLNQSLLSINGGALSYQYSGIDVLDISDNGNYVIVETGNPSQNEFFSKVVQRSPSKEGGLPRPNTSNFDFSDYVVANGINGPGNRAVGGVKDNAGATTTALYWDIAFNPNADITPHTFTTLAGRTSAEARDVSDDGSVVVGSAFNGGSSVQPLAVIMNPEDGAMTSLGALPDIPYSEALAVSADGRVIVGDAINNPFNGYTGIFWSQATGMVKVKDLLTSLGIDLTGWTIGACTDVSSDGLTLVGGGKNAANQSVCWIATIPNSVICPGDFDNSGFVDTDDYDTFVHAFEAGGDDADVDGSGFVDTDDFDFFVHHFEAGC